ncbi:MAG: 3-dehydroquinate synthase [Alistipes sp.]
MDCDFRVKQQSEIYINSVAEVLPHLLPNTRVVVISDTNIDRCHHALLDTRFSTILIGQGETIKTLSTIEIIYRRFIELEVDRSTFVLGIGGGIVTDLAGFAASTYMRGLSFGFLPTTLLGQVDAAIGGKNGVNIGGYKNMAGTFQQPKFVLCDVSLLRTLSGREFRSGLAEIVKAGIIADPDLFARLESVTLEQLRGDASLLTAVVKAAVRVKTDFVERDELEVGERRKLNLGHTLAHAIEKCSNKMNHGEAVAVGIAQIAQAAVRLGVLRATDYDRIVGLLGALGFDLTPPVSMKRLLQEVSKDKKSEGDSLYAVLPIAIGRCAVRKIPFTEFTALFR